MSKNTAFIAITGVGLIGLCVVLAVAVITTPPADDHMSDIKDTLLGTNLTYSNLAGRPMNYTITANDIGAVEKTEYNGAPAWKVHVGQGMSWDLTLDAEGRHILDTKQLFYT
jgi:hypothetical protein